MQKVKDLFLQLNKRRKIKSRFYICFDLNIIKICYTKPKIMTNNTRQVWKINIYSRLLLFVILNLINRLLKSNMEIIIIYLLLLTFTFFIEKL